MKLSLSVENTFKSSPFKDEGDSNTTHQFAYVYIVYIYVYTKYLYAYRYVYLTNKKLLSTLPVRESTASLTFIVFQRKPTRNSGVWGFIRPKRSPPLFATFRPLQPHLW